MAEKPRKKTANKRKTAKLTKKKTAVYPSVEQIVLLDKNINKVEEGDELSLIAGFIKAGKLVIICFDKDCVLVCSAEDSKILLKFMKNKPMFCESPFVVAGNPEIAEKHFQIEAAEREALLSSDSPAVYLRFKNPEDDKLNIICETPNIPVFLPQDNFFQVVFNSGNEMLAGAFVTKRDVIPPDVKDFKELHTNLADYFYFNPSGKIHCCRTRKLKIIACKPVTVSSGLFNEENPLILPDSLDTGPDILAVGNTLNNTVSIAGNDKLYFSSVSGDLKNPSCNDAFLDAIDGLTKKTGVSPILVAYDPAPDCLAGRYARSLEKVKIFPVQHHHAHVASCMAQNGETGRVLGVVYDHGGYGDDGNRWGAEFLAVSPNGYERIGHVRNARIPAKSSGEDSWWRMAVTYINMAYGYNTVTICRELFKSVKPEKIETAYEMLESKFNMVDSSSMSTFFDAMAAIIISVAGKPYLKNPVEALENLIRDDSGEDEIKPYPFELLDDGNLLLVDPAQTIYDMVENLLAMKKPSFISRRFFATIAHFTVEACESLRNRARTDTVVLTGGMFENRYFAESIIDLFENRDFKLLLHRDVPPGDAGISVGQAYVARACSIANEKK